MAVDPDISYSIIVSELEQCKEDATRYGWDISEINKETQSFTVIMISPIDQEKFILDVKFDNYKEIPLHLEFIDPSNGESGTHRAYPRNVGDQNGFFHGMPCICNPMSRKAYAEFGGPHNDWKMSNWMNQKQVSTLTNLYAILSAIYRRISTRKHYAGRMA